MREELERDWTVEQLAARAHMTPRTFARRFQQETGTTPLRWLIGQRVLLARQLLEESGESVEAVAVRVGFGSAAALRHHFGRSLGTTPQAYRRAFGVTCGGARSSGVGHRRTRVASGQTGRDQAWLAWLLPQVQTSSFVPSAVPPP